MKLQAVTLVLATLGTITFALPAPTWYISFEDTGFGGATYYDDQPGVNMNGVPSTGGVPGEINLREGGVHGGLYGEFINHGWWRGGGDYLGVTHPGGNGTIAMWAKLSIDAVHQNYPLLWDANPGNLQGWKCYTSFGSNGQQESFIVYSRPDSNYWTGTTQAPIPAKDQWFHYALSWELNEAETHLAMNLYIDGNRVQSATAFYDIYDTELRIGGGGSSLNHATWQGGLDEVYIFDVALTGEQVVAVMNTVPEPGTLAILGLGAGVLLRKKRK